MASYTKLGALIARKGKMALDHENGHPGSTYGVTVSCPDCVREHNKPRPWSTGD